MDKIEKIRAEIERRMKIYKESNYGISLRYQELEELLSFLDTLSEEPDKSLEEAAEEFAEGEWDGVAVDTDGNLLYAQGEIEYAFKAGAEWQKEQDQPITGNSLEKEWLRYVDKKKKECGGELPSLGEYGWLQIARHFAEWQKEQMPMPEDTVLFNKGVAEGRRLEREDMRKDAVEGYVNYYEDSCGILMAEAQVGCPYHNGDKVRIVVLKEEE